MTQQHLEAILQSQFKLLWRLPLAERNKRIDEIRADYEYEHLLDVVAAEVGAPDPIDLVQPEPSTLLQAGAAALFVGAYLALAIIAATPVPA